MFMFPSLPKRNRWHSFNVAASEEAIRLSPPIRCMAIRRESDWAKWGCVLDTEKRRHNPSETIMPIVNRVADLHADIQAWRRDIHQHPELLYDTHRTSAFVADRLREFGCDEVATG